MEGVSLGNRNINFSDNAISAVNAAHNVAMQPVQKYIDASNDKLKSSANINTSPVDIYTDYNEKKNDIVAVVVANTRHTDKRPSGALIGGAFGLFETLFFSGVYGLTKAFPALKKDKLINYFANKIDSWIQIAKDLHPERSLPRNITTGVLMKSLYLIGSGLVVGLATDIYKKIKLTNINGKISKNKQGSLGDNGFVAALNSLNTTEYGKNIINNSIRKNDDKSVTVRFNGVDREYNITKEELKNASKAYYAISDENGKVKSFKKKYCKADGDLLAYELAYEKFVNDIDTGNIYRNKNYPDYVYNSSIDKDGKIINSTVEQGLFLMTGMNPDSMKLDKMSDNPIKNIYSKIMMNRKILNLSNSDSGAMAVVKLKSNDGDNAVVFDKSNRRKRLNVNNYYVVSNVDGDYITLTNSSVSKEKITLPVSELTKNASEISELGDR